MKEFEIRIFEAKRTKNKSNVRCQMDVSWQLLNGFQMTAVRTGKRRMGVVIGMPVKDICTWHVTNVKQTSKSN